MYSLHGALMQDLCTNAIKLLRLSHPSRMAGLCFPLALCKSYRPRPSDLACLHRWKSQRPLRMKQSLWCWKQLRRWNNFRSTENHCEVLHPHGLTNLTMFVRYIGQQFDILFSRSYTALFIFLRWIPIGFCKVYPSIVAPWIDLRARLDLPRFLPTCSR